MNFPSTTKASQELGNENASKHSWSRESSSASIGSGSSWCGNSLSAVTPFDLWVGVYATAAVCVVGALGNAAALFVLMRAQTGSRSSVRTMFPVLRALSACDLALLLVWIPFQVLVLLRALVLVISQEENAASSSSARSFLTLRGCH